MRVKAGAMSTSTALSLGAIERAPIPRTIRHAIFTEEKRKNSASRIGATKSSLGAGVGQARRKMTLHRNPIFLCRNEQVAFCAAHIVPGLDFSNYPLLAEHSLYVEPRYPARRPNFQRIRQRRSAAANNHATVCLAGNQSGPFAYELIARRRVRSSRRRCFPLVSER